jgi:hypothetical protein
MPSRRSQLLLDSAPIEYGLLVTLDEQGARMELCPDQHLVSIHPHGHGPASLRNPTLLSGGGSGVRVFGGDDEKLGKLVMKHGSYKDTKELFALATISRELKQRRQMCCQEAADDMQRRIPDFRMVYMAPQHLNQRPKEYWLKFKAAVDALRIRQGGGGDEESLHSSNGKRDEGPLTDTTASTTTTRDRSSSLVSIVSDSSSSIERKKKEERAIRLYQSPRMHRHVVHVNGHSHAVDVLLGSSVPTQQEKNCYALRYGRPSEGYSCLKAFVDELVALQKKRGWKFTLAQKTIGGTSPKTAASHLAHGRLHGALLDKLIQEYCQVIRNLQQLTLPEDVHIVGRVQAELDRSDLFSRPADVSDLTDAFVGFAIKKNWHPETGRFYVLRRMGEAFRKKRLHLTKEEKIPAKMLGVLLKQGTNMQDVFCGAPARPTALESQGYKLDTWRTLLEEAMSFKSAATRDRIWNCGLSDGGLHNLFLSEDQMMYLFDMGEPKLMPLPAFLTKFLFSFFHTLGMVDNENGPGWVIRFETVVEGSLNKKTYRARPTKETKQLLPQAYNAFKITLDRLLEEFFDNEQGVRKLLVNYVTLQLLSDAAFCLERWKIKGGGRSRKSNHHKHIEEWLWRSIWDIYVASDLNSHKRLKYLGVLNPTWKKEGTSPAGGEYR